MVKQNRQIGNRWIAIGVTVLTAILLTATTPGIGLTWDEPYYIATSVTYLGWFKLLVKNPLGAFTSEAINQYWSITNQHPVLDRIWSGMIWSLSRHVLDDLTAHRLGNILLAAVLIGLLYLLVAQTYGKVAGLFSVAALMSMPRFFFHSHLAALDLPVAAAIFFVTFLFWRTVDRKEWWWGLVLGLAWGLAEAVKLNATFIPIGLLIWVLFFRRKWYLIFRFVLMGLVAVPTFFMVWPWLYHKTWARVIEYVNFNLHSSEHGQWYLGKYYAIPPWHFTLVMMWAVVPLTAILLALIGAVRAGKGRQDQGLGWLLIISVLVPLMPFVIAGFTAYDDDRLFIQVYPFLGALAGIGFGWFLASLRKWTQRINHPALLLTTSVISAAILLSTQVLTMTRLYPHLLSYYSEGLGGLPGATKLGLETTYWCETYAAAIPYINTHAQPGDKIWVEPDSYNVLLYYQLHGQLRQDVKVLNDVSQPASVFGPGSPQPIRGKYISANWYIFQYRQSQFGKTGYDFPVLAYLKNFAPPVFQISYQGVPLMGLYRR
jgi:4-amino-4-deoxy-L-arabinose transferase-like glycosyltransferase